MGKIELRKVDELACMTEQSITKERLYDIFDKNVYETIYVVDNLDDYTIKGIITLGNFRRHIMKNAELINHSYRSVQVDEEHTVDKLFALNCKINSIPVVDDKGRLVKEYRKFIEKQVLLKMSDLLEPIKTIVEENFIYDKLIFCGLQKDLEFARDFRYEICESIGLDELKRISKEDTVFILDFDEEKSRLRECMYHHYHIDCRCYAQTRYIVDEIKGVHNYNGGLTQYVCDRLSRYGKVAMFPFMKTYLNGDNGENYIWLEKGNIIWNIQEKCYEYMGHHDVECIFVLCEVFELKYMLMDGERIPVLSIYQEFSDAKTYTNDLDIVHNILPHLKEAGVSYYVIRDPQSEYSVVENIISEDISQRGKSYDIANREKVNRFVNYGISDDRDTVDYINELLGVSICKDGAVVYDGGTSKCVKTFGFERYTHNNKRDVSRNCYMFGPCIVRGAFAKDEHTIASRLAKHIADCYNVRNFGQSFSNIAHIMRSQIFHTGDMVIIFAKNGLIYEQKGIPTYSVIDAYLRVDELQNNLWDDLMHCNYKVLNEIAEEVYRICFEKNQSQVFANAEEVKQVKFGCRTDEQKGLDEIIQWLDKVSVYKRSLLQGQRAGAIVMNCNPFTLGHRYLVEQASKEVNVLYIFVLEEDKSYIRFEDRYKMVKMGVEDLENVVVIPSGRYIISTMTMPGYFEKDSVPFVEKDAAEDLELFAKVIAKHFDIEVRFAGQEPIDQFTKRYNESMAWILPKYNIEFCEIPRKVKGGEVISASRVRRHMESGEYEEAKKLLMPNVYEYLEKKYFDKD